MKIIDIKSYFPVAFYGNEEGQVRDAGGFKSHIFVKYDEMEKLLSSFNDSPHELKQIRFEYDVAGKQLVLHVVRLEEQPMTDEELRTYKESFKLVYSMEPTDLAIDKIR